jgi:predicted transcriptional regulator
MLTRYDSHLSRRERQIMEIIYQRGQASVADVLEAMARPPSYSSVRTIMNLMVAKGCLKYKEDGRKYVYYPALAREKARRSAVNSLLQTFFDGSVAQAVVSLINLHMEDLSAEDLNRLSRMIKEAQKEGDDHDGVH